MVAHAHHQIHVSVLMDGPEEHVHKVGKKY